MLNEIYENEFDNLATLSFSEGVGWFVDLGSQLWNRYYDRRSDAVRYLTKNGYVFKGYETEK